MEVTRVKVNPIHTEDGYYKAAATIYLSGGYAVNGILIAEREGKVKIRFPFVAKNDKDDGSRTFAFTPISSQARAEVEAAIRRAYYQTQSQNCEAPQIFKRANRGKK